MLCAHVRKCEGAIIGKALEGLESGEGKYWFWSWRIRQNLFGFYNKFALILVTFQIKKISKENFCMQLN